MCYYGRYRIEYDDGRHNRYEQDRKSLIKYLKKSGDEHIRDIRRVYKDGRTDSVFEIYSQYIGKDR